MREVITLDLKKACSRSKIFRLWGNFYAARAKNPNARFYVLSGITDTPQEPREVWAVVSTDGAGEEIAKLFLPEELSGLSYPGFVEHTTD
jgi:hypothetical protein